VSVIVVSNRVARAKTDEPIAGGLASALIPVIKESGAIWVGSSGHTDPVQVRDSFAKIEALGKGALATVDIPAKHYRGYYEGFANSALWPALHSRPDLIQVTAEEYASYREVNAFMARALLRFTNTDAAIWVQDYHFLTLGADLRRLKIGRPIGFFLHTPWPERSTVAAVPHHADLVSAMLAYDLIGFQTDDDRHNFEEYLRYEFGMLAVDGAVGSAYGLTRLAPFPIGIDVEEFASRATRAMTRPDVARLRASLDDAKLALGVDRLDYSKGLPNRMRAFDRMLDLHPEQNARSRCCRLRCPRAATSAPTGISRPISRRWSGRSTAGTAKSIGTRSVISTRGLPSRRWLGSTASPQSAW
jgi:trehalose 6-phosphate synthase